MIESVINAPVWIQTPLVLLVMLVVCIPVAVGLRLLVFRILPPTAEERRLLGKEVETEEEKERAAKP